MTNITASPTPLTGANLKKQDGMNGESASAHGGPLSARAATGEHVWHKSREDELITGHSNLDRKKRQYSTSIYEYTKSMWEDVRSDIERRASQSTYSLDSSSTSGTSSSDLASLQRTASLARQVDTGSRNNSTSVTQRSDSTGEVAGTVGAVPAIH